MGCSNYSYYRKPNPCANCGKRGGFMGSSKWRHDYLCCSDACGMRLSHKLQNGMGGPYRAEDELYFDHNEDRLASLRLEIKLLRHRLKRANTLAAASAQGDGDGK